MPKTSVVSVVIVSWNVAELLPDCINSLLAASQPGFKLEIIVVDNASGDGSSTLVRQHFPQVKLIANAHNFGFGRACNQGWRQSDGEYVFFLNPDATVAPDSLQILLDFIQANQQVAIVGPQLRYPDGSIQSNRRRFLSPVLAFVESTVLQRYRPFKNLPALHRFYMQNQPSDTPQQVDWLVGAALLVRREVLETTGGFDERYFMYSEESDLARACRPYGQVWYVPPAQVMHREGVSSAKDVAQRHLNFQTSKVSYFRKWHGPLFAAVLKNFLLATYLFQGAEEGAKYIIGHKRPLRRERLQIVRKVLASGLRPYHSPWPHTTSETRFALITAEFAPQPGGVGDYTACLAHALTEENTRTVEVITNNLISSWNWSCLGQITNYVKQKRFDVLNIQYQTGAYQMHPAINCLPLYLKWKLRSQPRPQVVTTFHDLREPYLFPKAGPLRRWVTQLLLRGSDYSVVTNIQDYGHALALGIAPSHLKLIPISSNITPLPRPNTHQRGQWRQQWGIAPDLFVIGYFGLLNRSKGVDILLKALARLKNLDWKFLLIGGETGLTDPTNAAYAQELTALAHSLGLTDKIIWTGHLEPISTSQALYALDMAVLPFRDGASLRRGSLLATLAHALAVLTTSEISSEKTVPDLKVPQLSHLQNCYMLDMQETTEAQTVVQLAEAIQLLYSDPDLRTRLAENALRLTRENFGWPAIAAAFLEVFLV